MKVNNETEKEKTIHEKLDNTIRVLEDILKSTQELHAKIEEHFKRIG